MRRSRAWWAAPRELLGEWEAGGLKLYWPTYHTLIHLAECTEAGAVFGLRFPTREPSEDELARLPESVFG